MSNPKSNCFTTVAFMVFTLFLMSSCEYLNSIKIGGDLKPNFDIPALMNKQIDSLKKHGNGVSKIIRFDQEIDTVSVENPIWEEELISILNLDINQPKFRDAFKEQAVLTKSGDLEVEYLSKEEIEKGPVKVKVVFYDEERKFIKSLIIDFLSYSHLYHRYEIYTLNFDKEDRLDSYEIKGGEKVKMMDSTTFEIKATVLDPRP